MVSIPGTQALWVGAGIAVVFGGITLAVWSQGGPLWKGSIPTALGLCLFVVGLQARIRSLLLWRSGRVCEGEVIHVYTKQTSQGAGYGSLISHAVQYEFLVDGKQYVARHGTFGVWKEGPVWIIYDAKNPKRSMPQRGN
jgi:hypothetical protein